MSLIGKLLKGAFATSVACTVLTACSGGGGSGDSPSTDDGLTISGTLGLGASLMSTVSTYGVTLSDLEIYAICLASTPDIAQGSVSSSGAFSVTLDCPTGSIVTAIFRNKTSMDEVATVVFEDSSSTDMSGEAKKSSAFKLNGDVSVGSITLNPDTGEVVIPISQVASGEVETGTSDGSSHTMTGQWTVAAMTAAGLPTGYNNACAADDNDCHGPKVGEAVNFVQVNGTEWQRDATCVADVDADGFDASSETCGGAAGTDKKSVLMMFNSPAAITSCSGTTGFNEQAAKAFAGIYFQSSDFTGTGLTMGFHTFSAALGADGWKNPNAKAQFTMHDCRPFDLPTDLKNNADAAAMLNGSTVGWACKLTGADDIVGSNGASAWRVGTGGGCVDATTEKPVMVENWGGMTSGSYTQLTGLPTGWEGGSNTMTGDHDNDATTADVTLTCRHLSAYYADSSGNPGAIVAAKTDDADGTPNEMGTESTIAQGTACSSIGGGTSLQALQCYANFYWKYLERGEAVPDMNSDGDTSDSGEGSLCARKMSFDYGTQDGTKFADVHSNWSSGQDFVGLMAVNGSSFSVEDEPRVESRGIDTGSGWVPCRVSSTGRITFTKKSDTQYVIEYVRSGKLLDYSKPACVAAAQNANTAEDLEVGTSKYMFLLNK